jgi:hypothetical protein
MGDKRKEVCGGVTYIGSLVGRQIVQRDNVVGLEREVNTLFW